jgi:hypothetical protein
VFLKLKESRRIEIVLTLIASACMLLESRSTTSLNRYKANEENKPTSSQPLRRSSILALDQREAVQLPVKPRSRRMWYKDQGIKLVLVVLITQREERLNRAVISLGSDSKRDMR